MFLNVLVASIVAKVRRGSVQSRNLEKEDLRNNNFGKSKCKTYDNDRFGVLLVPEKSGKCR